ncbi:porin [Paraburkholderia sp. J63]|uniref:porin n=1 Tax=Paraburkholderia sp. J63 TaxID=2805434 RepID=UPI002ABE5F78|nr:porin [Paraburkholderia sp. J63]
MEKSFKEMVSRRFLTGLSATCLWLVASTASAQSSLTLYGDLDLGAQYLTKANSKGNSVFGLQSGNASPTRFGLTGEEDLGSGYKAIFKLEGGFNIANGSNIVANTPFDRYAYVGMDSPYGKLTLGRQRSLLFERSILYDPTYLAQFSSMSTNDIPLASLGQNNAIKYETPEWRGLDAALMYGFGQEIPGNSRAGRFVSGAVEYHNDTLGTRAVYEETRGSMTTTPALDESGLVDRRVSLAARYRIASTTAYAWFTNVSGDLHFSPAGNVYGGGLSQQISPFLSLVAEVNHYQTHDEQGHPTWFTVGAFYNLSKRTSLYAFCSTLRINGGSGFTVNTYDFSSPGNENQTGVQIGINHLF